MIRKNIKAWSLLIIILLSLCVEVFAYDWGVKPKNKVNPPYPIYATLGEYRVNKRLHSGVDIYGVYGDEVRAIDSGPVIVNKNDLDTNNESITVGRFTYVHVDVEKLFIDGGDEQETAKTYCQAGDLIAKIKNITSQHLHLTEKDELGNKTNPLRIGGLTGFSDFNRPVVNNILFYKNGSNERYDNIENKVIVLSNDVDILAQAYDRQSNNGSNSVGIYETGYQVRNELFQEPLVDVCNIRFDKITSSDVVTYVYNTNTGFSNNSTYYYWATNKMYSNDYWDTTQHPDGKYTVSVLAWDIAGNGGDVAGSKGAASQKVIINNKRPVIKSISVADNSDADKMFKAGDKIELAIEFDEQLNLDKLPVLYIGAPKADGEKVEWVKVNGLFQRKRALS